MFCTLVTLYVLFTDEKHDVLLDTWMLSGPKTKNMWYNKPPETFNDMLKNYRVCVKEKDESGNIVR